MTICWVDTIPFDDETSFFLFYRQQVNQIAEVVAFWNTERPTLNNRKAKGLNRYGVDLLFELEEDGSWMFLVSRLALPPKPVKTRFYNPSIRKRVLLWFARKL